MKKSKNKIGINYFDIFLSIIFIFLFILFLLISFDTASKSNQIIKEKECVEFYKKNDYILQQCEIYKDKLIKKED